MVAVCEALFPPDHGKPQPGVSVETCIELMREIGRWSENKEELRDKMNSGKHPGRVWGGKSGGGDEKCCKSIGNLFSSLAMTCDNLSQEGWIVLRRNNMKGCGIDF